MVEVVLRVPEELSEIVHDQRLVLRHRRQERHTREVLAQADDALLQRLVLAAALEELGLRVGHVPGDLDVLLEALAVVRPAGASRSSW